MIQILFVPGLKALGALLLLCSASELSAALQIGPVAPDLFAVSAAVVMLRGTKTPQAFLTIALIAFLNDLDSSGRFGGAVAAYVVVSLAAARLLRMIPRGWGTDIILIGPLVISYVILSSAFSAATDASIPLTLSLLAQVLLSAGYSAALAMLVLCGIKLLTDRDAPAMAARGLT